MVWVNLSAKQFQQSNLVDEVAEALQKTGLYPSSLGLEITESTAMEDEPSLISTLQELAALGVQLAIDDFGTGYSSLSYLRRFPVDTLKLDRSFIEEVVTDAGTRAIVQSVTALAHALTMTVTAEGIETAAQLTVVRELGCDRGQGYYFARPLPPEAMTEAMTEVACTAI